MKLSDICAIKDSKYFHITSHWTYNFFEIFSNLTNELIEYFKSKQEEKLKLEDDEVCIKITRIKPGGIYGSSVLFIVKSLTSNQFAIIDINGLKNFHNYRSIIKHVMEKK